MKIEIYTDGGSRGNPGKSAIGYIIHISNQEPIRHGEYIGITTNNVAEYTAILNSLQRVKQELNGKNLDKLDIELKLDSELAQKQLLGIYKVKQDHLKLFVKSILDISTEFKSIQFIHIRRELNKEADKMVNIALNNQL